MQVLYVTFFIILHAINVINFINVLVIYKSHANKLAQQMRLIDDHGIIRPAPRILLIKKVEAKQRHHAEHLVVRQILDGILLLADVKHGKVRVEAQAVAAENVRGAGGQRDEGVEAPDGAGAGARESLFFPVAELGEEGVALAEGGEDVVDVGGVDEADVLGLLICVLVVVGVVEECKGGIYGGNSCCYGRHCCGFIGVYVL